MMNSFLSATGLILLTSTLTSAAAIKAQPNTGLLRRTAPLDITGSPDVVAANILASGGIDGGAGINSPLCLQSTEGPVGEPAAYVYYVQIPQWQTPYVWQQAVSDLKGSLGGNAACASGEHVGFQWKIVGNVPTGGSGSNTTVAASTVVSTFCTPYQMTKVLAATTGQAGIPCTPLNQEQAYDRPDEQDPPAVDGDDDPAADEGLGEDIGDDIGPEKMKRDLTPEEERSHWVWIKGGPK